MTSEHISKPTVTALRRTNRSLPIALLRAREMVMGPIRDMLVDSPVNEQKWRVLRVLEERGPLDQNSIAREACLLLPSLTRILRTMEAEGLVTRRVASDDRRRSIVSIEAAGLAILQDHSVQASALVDRLRAHYGEEKLEQLLDLLEDLQVAEEKR